VGVLRELGEALLEVHGQHETVGLLDARTHRPMLDAMARSRARPTPWRRPGAAGARRAKRVEALREEVAVSAAETEELTFRLSELDRLDPRAGEETELAEARAILGAPRRRCPTSRRPARSFDGLGGKVAAAIRALERARERAMTPGAAARAWRWPAWRRRPRRWTGCWWRPARPSGDRRGARAFEFEPDRLEKAEERLFDLRGLARKLGVSVEELPILRARSPSACGRGDPPRRR
jgi:DNA repair protein RecN (Recombination protein N)